MTHVLLNFEGPIAVVSLDRPKRLNAIDVATWRELARVFKTLHSRQELRCVIVRSTSDHAFSVGADLSEFPTLRADQAQAAEYEATIRPAFEAFASIPAPVVVAVEGVCIGGGLELALGADIVIAGKAARFGVPVAKIGQWLPPVDLHALVRRLGPAVTRELLLEGALLGAVDAHAKGIVSRIVVDGEAFEEAKATALRISAGAPLAARWHKAGINGVLADQLSQEDASLAFASAETTDYQEGVRAFLEKRTPQFIGT